MEPVQKADCDPLYLDAQPKLPSVSHAWTARDCAYQLQYACDQPRMEPEVVTATIKLAASSM